MGNGFGNRWKATRVDMLSAWRAFLYGAAVLAVAAAVVVSTDEQSTSTSARLGRLASMVAVAGAVGTFLAIEQARSRGEVRALAALGVSPWRASRGAAVGGILVALAGPALALSDAVDLSPLFPRMDAVCEFRELGPATVVKAMRGVVLKPSGGLERIAAQVVRAAPGPIPRFSTVGTLLVLAVLVPFWASVPIPIGRRAAVGIATVLACVVGFHLVAASRAPPAILPCMPLVLLFDIGLLRRAERRFPCRSVG